MEEIGVGLRWAVEACRSADCGSADRFAQGEPHNQAELAEFMPRDVLADLDKRGLIARREGIAQLRVRCHNFNDLVSVMPLQQTMDADFVHLNSDTFWLLQLVWEHGGTGNYAVELGTGNGIVAAHMVARYRRVLATDVKGPWLGYAQLTLAANAGRGRPSAVVACDVATALRPGMFDLVAANSPWSPAVPVDEDGNALTFMAGGRDRNRTAQLGFLCESGCAAGARRRCDHSLLRPDLRGRFTTIDADPRHAQRRRVRRFLCRLCGLGARTDHRTTAGKAATPPQARPPPRRHHPPPLNMWLPNMWVPGTHMFRRTRRRLRPRLGRR